VILVFWKWPISARRLAPPRFVRPRRTLLLQVVRGALSHLLQQPRGISPLLSPRLELAKTLCTGAFSSCADEAHLSEVLSRLQHDALFLSFNFNIDGSIHSQQRFSIPTMPRRGITFSTTRIGALLYVECTQPQLTEDTVFVHVPPVSRDDRPNHHLAHQNMKLLSHIQ
jgi:hypothetical protein